VDELEDIRNFEISTRWNNNNLCIPSEWGRALAINRHEKNHFGKTRSQTYMSSQFHWIGMSKDVATVVKSCMDCQRRKKPKLMAGPLHKVEAHRKWERVQIDLYSGIPNTNGKTAIMVTDKKALSVAQAFWSDVVAQFGFPEIIQTDRGLVQHFTLRVRG
jgi:hypothetical protein